MNSVESVQLRKGDKVNMVVTGGSGRIYRGVIIDRDDEGNMIRWGDGEVGKIEHQYADYLSKPVVITATCGSCDNEDRDSKENLERSGWKITDAIELCPLCNFG